MLQPVAMAWGRGWAGGRPGRGHPAAHVGAPG